MDPTRLRLAHVDPLPADELPPAVVNGLKLSAGAAAPTVVGARRGKRSACDQAARQKRRAPTPAAAAAPAATAADSWANITANLDALNDDKAVSTIKLMDATAPDMTISAAEATRDARALAALSASWPISIAVVDTAAALEALAALPSARLCFAGFLHALHVRPLGNLRDRGA